MKRSAASLAVLLVAAFSFDAAAEESGFTAIFNGRDLSGWVPVNVAPDTFRVQDGMIVTTGVPKGFLRTERQYQNFILEFDWQIMADGGNTGLLLWTDG